MKKILMGAVITFVLMSYSGIDVSALLEPGTDQDPLVTMGYVEKRIEQLQYYVDKNFEKSGSAENLDSVSESYQVVKVDEGKTVIFGESTEFILRSGEGSIISGENGISDLTDGVDLLMGNPVPKNHLLLVPKSDGRGFKADTLVYLMIKGKYNIN